MGGEWGKRALLSNFLRVTNISMTHDFFLLSQTGIFLPKFAMLIDSYEIAEI